MDIKEITNHLEKITVLKQEIIDYCFDNLENYSYIDYGNMNEYKLKVLVTTIEATLVKYYKEIYCTSFPELMCEFIKFPKGALKKYLNSDLLIIYDLQYIKGANDAQIKVLDILKSLISNHKNIIIMANCKPNELQISNELKEILKNMHYINLTLCEELKEATEE